MGCTMDGQFCPDGSVTRGEMASFIARALRLRTPIFDYFSDDAGNAHEPNINALVANGISIGCDNSGNFCPDQPVSRSQMAAFLYWSLSPPELGEQVRRFQEDELVDSSNGMDTGMDTEELNQILGRGAVAPMVINNYYKQNCLTNGFCPTYSRARRL
ncbi:MAG: S-layer homology domain-containing protein [Actinomycetota bacterium]|nr:S-layer homology domain-containing protein [Actinomycetota bacterium]